jgi:hypothetical protein
MGMGFTLALLLYLQPQDKRLIVISPVFILLTWLLQR